MCVIKLLSMLPKVYNGSHIKSPLLEYHQVSEFSLIPKKDEILNIDGEISNGENIKISFLEKKLPIYY